MKSVLIEPMDSSYETELGDIVNIKYCIYNCNQYMNNGKDYII